MEVLGGLETGEAGSDDHSAARFAPVRPTVRDGGRNRVGVSDVAQRERALEPGHGRYDGPCARREDESVVGEYLLLVRPARCRTSSVREPRSIATASVRTRTSRLKRARRDSGVWRSRSSRSEMTTPTQCGRPQLAKET